ncbi:hypothetical protein PIB30_081504 [Stylosanthes scabra]|uniref:Uncharacterized protein n=1 Tax=Stylosanthes scabra TaxID=79078 RepID=A0ABU6SSE2_9FABA|nr:hypothetical protein [Stylosanthes scabra]
MIHDPLILLLQHLTCKKNGGPRSVSAPSGRISTFPGVPSRHCPSSDHHIHTQRRLLMLLPLGQVSLLPSIFLIPPFPPSIPFLSYQIQPQRKEGRKLAGVDARGRPSQVHCHALPLPAIAATQHPHCDGGEATLEATSAAPHPFVFVTLFL